MKRGSPALRTRSPFTPYQSGVIALLAFLQFTTILDFTIISPLGVLMMRQLSITPTQFGFAVSVFAFAAGASGLLAAGFSDRFDRKKMLLVFYAGFLFGTLLCGIAHTYAFLLFARVVTGIFAGVLGSTVFAITTDLFPFEARGRVMGYLQTAFAASSIIGIPLGLYLAGRWSWNAPFLMIVALGVLVGIAAVRYLRPIDAHLKLQTDRSALHHLWHILATPRYLQGIGTVCLLATGAFILMPYSSTFSVNNLGLTIQQLPPLYTVTGLCSIVAGPLIGRASDAYGKFRVFCFGCAATSVMVLIYTHLGVTPLSLVILVNCLLFVGVSSRMISSSALLSAVPSETDRGAYMSVSSSVQQISGGIAAVIGGAIVSEGATGALEHFDIVGYLLVGTTLVTLVMMYLINERLKESGKVQASPRAALPAAAVDHQ
jgi:predicted MFS family arabinose efflux permease